MLTDPPSEADFSANTNIINADRLANRLENKHIKRAITLAQAKGGGHDQFLTGIMVTMDITVSNKCWVEMERYTFLNFISSMSTMHRISKMNIGDCCNPRTDYRAIAVAQELQQKYLDVPDENVAAKTEAYQWLLYNLPSGFELTAGMITNYRCLKNIWAQRRNHRLKSDWGVFCDWIEELPMAEHLIMRRIED